VNYYSLNNQSPRVSFREAVITGIAPDRGLYFPERIQPLPDTFFKGLHHMSEVEIAYAAISQFVGNDIPERELQAIISEVLDFPFPIVEIEKSIGALELFHGPTMAFKDVGARFMARCLGYFSQGKLEEVTVLVATSGDTGGAVANGFLDVPGVKVVILYPQSKVSDIQERQLTTLGNNINALEVDGSFDDCQRMVKKAFLDTDLNQNLRLTSANSINVARWLPQMFYYLFAVKQLGKKAGNLVFSVPSGNFGNLCAGMVAQRLGMPVVQFIAATNINDTVPRFMVHGTYNPKPSFSTISNAMDVGDPSNFVRILHLFEDNLQELRTHLSACAFTDEETKRAIGVLYEKTGYIADPHGAVGYLGLKKCLSQFPGAYGVFLETAHPVKFPEVVESTIGRQIEIPQQILKVMHGEKASTKIATYEELKSFLISN
jgi:threonine synthase